MIIKGGVQANRGCTQNYEVQKEYEVMIEKGEPNSTELTSQMDEGVGFI